jgi:hypothetical protein
MIVLEAFAGGVPVVATEPGTANEAMLEASLVNHLHRRGYC